MPTLQQYLDDPTTVETGGCKEPYNPLDPVVYFDPTFVPPIIVDVTPNLKSRESELLNSQYGSDTDPLAVEGVTIPKIQVGGKVILSTMLRKFVLDYQYITPTLYLEILSNNGEVVTNIDLSINNVVRVAFRPSEDGKYKKIAWNFHVVNFKKHKNIMRIWCELKYKKLAEPIGDGAPLQLSEFTKLVLNDVSNEKIEGAEQDLSEESTKDEPDVTPINDPNETSNSNDSQTSTDEEIEESNNNALIIELKNAAITIENYIKEMHVQIGVNQDAINSTQDEITKLEDNIDNLEIELHQLEDDIEDDPTNQEYLNQITNLKNTIAEKTALGKELTKNLQEFEDKSDKLNAFLPKLGICKMNINNYIGKDSIEESFAQTLLDEYKNTEMKYFEIKDYSLNYIVDYNVKYDELIEDNNQDDNNQQNGEQQNSEEEQKIENEEEQLNSDKEDEIVEEEYQDPLNPDEDTSDREYNCCQILAEFANRLSLGFAASDDCLSDKSKRIYYPSSSGASFKEIQEIVRTLGSSEYIYDAWIDPYGYLVLVNMAHLFSAEIEADHLIVMGLTGTMIQSHNGPQPKYKPVRRVITNYKQTNSPSNLQFINYDKLENYSAAYKNGITRKITMLTPEDGSNVKTTEEREAEEKELQAQEEAAATVEEAVDPTTTTEGIEGATIEQESTSKSDSEPEPSSESPVNNYSDVITKFESGEKSDLECKSRLDQLKEENKISDLRHLYVYMSLLYIESYPGSGEFPPTFEEFEGCYNLLINDTVNSRYKSLNNKNETGTLTKIEKSEYDIFISFKFWNFSWDYHLLSNKLKSNNYTYEEKQEAKQRFLDQYNIGIKKWLDWYDVNVWKNGKAEEEIEQEEIKQEIIEDDFVARYKQDKLKKEQQIFDAMQGKSTNEEDEIEEEEDGELDFEPNNSLGTVDVETNVIPSDVVGPGSQEYSNNASEFYIDNMNGSGKQFVQEHVSRTFIQNKRMSKLAVLMDDVNMGLQRGTWIQVAAFEYGLGEKADLLAGHEITPVDAEHIFWGQRNVNTGGVTKEDIITNEDIGLPNDKISDLYYIDGITFIWDYNSEDKKMQQILYLIKKSKMPISR